MDINSKQVFNNAKWIIVCKIAQSILQLIIGMLCARYLGPANYGLINYASAVVAFAMPLMKLGFDAVLVHELVDSPEKEGEIMGTALTMNVLSSLACMAGVATFVSFANSGDLAKLVVCILYSTSLVFAALEMIQYWFQYKLLSKYSSLVMLISYVIVSLYRCFLLIFGKSVYWFALTHSLDFCIIGISLILIYKKKTLQKLSFSFSRAKILINKGKFYILASLMVVIIQNTDHIMITTMIGEAENGYYSAAITCVSVVQFVFYAIIDSYRPLILTKKKENSQDYEKSISGLYSIILYMAIAQSIVFTVFAKLIIYLLYGDAYLASVPLLQILVWFVAFSYMGVVRNVWILAEQKQSFLWIINLLGATFNIILNAVLIPSYGAAGAAVASFATQVFANFIIGFIIKPLRPNNMLMLKGLNPKFFVTTVKEFVCSISKK